ncbi:uncharacterized protein LOC141912712 [Tubulanus polymorphus]|uniref:uncharacterized protein LOC141912712 n=1 Tax=Tubulanus polymorphus TaxID=672921 RepID=UPI003DA1E0A2
MANSIEELIVNLYDIEAVKFGSFTLKSGIQSPVYFDLRVIVSYPQILKVVSEKLWSASRQSEYDVVCGVPYTALPIATVMSVDHDIPMLIRRKEAKDYGTKKMLEGRFKNGDKCLIVEDVVTSGSSVAETADLLRNNGLTVTDAVVLLDREQGGRQKLANQGIRLHSICPLSKVLEVLQRNGKLSKAIVDSVHEFIRENQFTAAPPIVETIPEKILSYETRMTMCTNPLTKRLLQIMAEKKTNLCIAADYPNVGLNLITEFADEVGPHICMLKLHTDFIPVRELDCKQYQTQMNQLQEIAVKHNFLIFDDRKYADIGNTVSIQYGAGTFNTVSYSHIVTVHPLPGAPVIDALKKVAKSHDKERGCLLIGQMSCEGCLIDDSYTQATVAMALEHKDFVIGLICREKLTSDPSILHCVPGVKLEEGKDSLGQQYQTPSVVIGQKGCDVIIVGRGITQAENPGLAAQQYKQAGYQAYLNQL